MTFSKKIIEIEVQLVNKQFQSGNTKVRLSGLPMSVQIDKGGLPSFNTANITVRGLSLDRMEALSSLNIESMTGSRHKIAIWAGDSPEGLAMIFSGDIKNAIADFGSAPDIEMRFECFCAYFDALTPQEPIAIQGESRVADVIGSIATNLGYTFLNQGVESKVKDTVVHGDPRTKMMRLAKQVGAKLCIDDENVILAPGDKPFRTTITDINAKTGLVGYPVVDNASVRATCFFNPSIRFGSQVKIDSVVPRASGTWRVTKVTHSLSANDPDGGDWFTIVHAYFNNGL